MSTATLRLSGKKYVVLEQDEYRRLKAMAEPSLLPPLPKPAKDGTYPAIEYARASLARKIVRDRTKVGLNQKELARRAGIRVETLNRIETGKTSPGLPTIEKIDRVLRKYE